MEFLSSGIDEGNFSKNIESDIQKWVWISWMSIDWQFPINSEELSEAHDDDTIAWPEPQTVNEIDDQQFTNGMFLIALS